VLLDPMVCLTSSHPSLRPLVSEPVTFTVTGGGGTVGGGNNVTVNTGTDGCAHAPWTLGSSPGVNTLQATAFAFGSPQAFAATGFSFSSLDAGERQSCYVASTGVAYCWGSNSFGQLGNGGTSDASVPTVVSGGLTLGAISSTFNYTCALGSDGRASCWGQNRSGRLGDGTTTDRSTPVPVSGGLTFTSISTGGLHSCGLTSIGTAYCWGDNSFGQLGSSPAETCTTPFGTTPCSTTPAAVSGGLTFRAINAGFFHTCGLRDDGAAFCWGRGILGNLGTGTRTNAAAPVPVTGGLTFESLTAGAEYTCGLATGGVAYCWGVNSGGQLGLGPTNLSGVSVPTPVLGELRFVFLSAANENNIFGHTCGVAVGGAAYCWGGDLAGEIGAPTSETCPGFGGDAPHPCATSPVPVSGGLSFTTTAAGIDHTCGLAPSGDVYCWGGNNRGQLGNGTTTASSTPVLVSNPAPASP
jgi:alpha-tubulin suppressor-like RCC1 family protein